SERPGAVPQGVMTRTQRQPGATSRATEDVTTREEKWWRVRDSDGEYVEVARVWCSHLSRVAQISASHATRRHKSRFVDSGRPGPLHRVPSGPGPAGSCVRLV